MSKYTIGIDLGGTTMTAGIVNENYEIVGKLTWATRLPRPAEDLEKALADLCRTVARDNKVDFADIKYVGIGTPGSVNFTTGFVGFNTNFGYYDWNLGPDLEALLGCKVYVENDANAAPTASTLRAVQRGTTMRSSLLWAPASAAALSWAARFCAASTSPPVKWVTTSLSRTASSAPADAGAAGSATPPPAR